ncbi:MAG: hypothetical protein JWP87_6505, partial [Labilithrix sp.]|nr:hypothetical protein [Labilithrix sp.]
MNPEQHAGQDEELLARVRMRAKSAWAASIHEDDLTRRAASEQRLMAAWPRPRVLPVRAFVLGAATAACVAALAFVAQRSLTSATSPPLEANANGRAAPHGTNAPGVTAQTAATSASTDTLPALAVGSLPGATPAAPAVQGMMMTGACPDCRVGGAPV